jgi:hypothetical protein
MANKGKMLNLPWQIGRELTVQVNNIGSTYKQTKGCLFTNKIVFSAFSLAKFSKFL